MDIAPRKIITVYVHPPIPIRNHDWCAHWDGDEESPHLYVWAETEERAIKELTESVLASFKTEE